MILRTALLLFLVAFGFLAETFSQNAPGTDKHRYSLFDPTPDASMRELVTDRPDKTESPITVDAGHFQVEMDFLNYIYDHSEQARIKNLAIAPINLKVGLLNNLDVQIVVQSYNIVRTDDQAGRSRASGFGDVLLRVKANLWGNDGGSTAFGVMPFVKVPTNQDNLGNDALEGGIILPLAIKLPGEWDLGTMLEVDHVQDSSGADYHQEIIQSVTVGHAIVGSLSGYAELFSNRSLESNSEWVATFDCGLTYGLNRNVQFDAGINIGLTDAADDWNPFIGVSVRY